MLTIQIKQRASLAHARVKMDVFAAKGYQLIGSLPEELVVWQSMKLGVSLFQKEGRYYQCKNSFLFLEYSPEEIESCFDEQQEPRPDQPFSQIITSSYIFLLLGNGLFLLRKDASQSGHSYLAGPHREEEDIVGGELYFEQGSLLLVANKSSNYPTSSVVALTALIKVLGDSVKEQFRHATEQTQVDFELASQRVDNAARKRSSSSASSSGLFAIQPITPSIPQPPQKQGCLPCTIM
jgi:hypothetical protein